MTGNNVNRIKDKSKKVTGIKNIGKKSHRCTDRKKSTVTDQVNKHIVEYLYNHSKF